MRKPTLILVLFVVSLALASIAPAPAAPAAPASASADTPEDIDFGSYMALTANHIYYSSGGSTEIKCTELINEVYGRVPNGQGQAAREQFLLDCDAAPFPRSAMVSDGSTTFFISYVETFDLYALFARPADGSGSATQLTLDNHLAQRALAIDKEFVYYAVVESTSYIFRRNIASGTVEVVATLNDVNGDSINGLTLDDTHVYWTEGAENGVGRVRRAVKTGGPPLLVADNLGLPWDLMTYNDVVYWTELDGERVARRLKNGAGVTDTVHQSDRQVTALYLHNDVLYFAEGDWGTQNGSLWRATSGGIDPVLMAYGFAPPTDIAWVGGWIYWVDSHLRRLPPDTKIEGVDYVIEQMEVTQGVQNGANSIPLVATKPTFVRVYARELQGTSADSVRARLHGFRNGAPLPGSPLQPFQNSNLDLDPALPLREEPEGTFVFLLPISWTSAGQFQLQAEVNPNNQVFEYDFDNNRYPQNPATFKASSRLTCLVTFPVAAATEEGDTVIFDNDPAIYNPRMDRVAAMLPSLLWVTKEANEIWLINEDLELEPHNLVTGSSALLASISAVGMLSDPPEGCTQDVTRYGGLVHTDAFWGGNFGGMAGGNRFWARYWISDSDEDYNQPAGGPLWAHELTHTLGRPHVDCGGASGPGYYPYDPCQAGDSDAEDASWGYDAITGVALNPVETRDLMAYGSKKWLSDFTWQCVFDYLGEQIGDPDKTGVQGCDWPLGGEPFGSMQKHGPAEDSTAARLVLEGLQITQEEWSISSMADYITIDFLTEAQRELIRSTPNSGAYQLVLFDARGGQIAAKFFDLEQDDQYPQPGQPGRFRVAVTHYDSPPARMVIRDSKSGEVLVERLVSDTTPELLPESALINSAGNLEMKFKASDADGDPFQVMAQYIDANGRIQVIFPWRPYGAPDFPCAPCTFPGRTLAGGAGFVRLHASDGLRTTVKEIRLPVPGHAPEVAVNPVQHGRTAADGAATFLIWPAAWDAEDGQISPRLFKWFVNGRRVNCDCAVLPLSAESLGPTPAALAATATVALEVTDSDNQTTRATAVVNLNPAPTYRAQLPIVLWK